MVLAGMILIVPWGGASGQARSDITFTATPPEIVFAIEADPPSSSRLDLRVSGAGAASARLIRLTSNLGEISAPRRTAAGWEADFTPPVLDHPAAALILAVIERAGTQSHHWLSLPVATRGMMTFDAPTGSQVLAQVHGKRFGPVTAVRGKATVPVELAPGANRLEVLVTPPKGNEQISGRPLKLPSFSRMALSAPVTAASGETVAVEAFVVDAAGRLFTVDLPALKVTAPGATVLRLEGSRSVRRIWLRLPEAAQDVTVNVALTQESGVESVAVIKVKPGRNVKLQVSADPAALQIGSSQAAIVTVLATDQAEAPADIEGLRVTAAGQPVAMDRVGPGEYRGFTYAPTGRNPARRVEIRAQAPGSKEARTVIRIRGGAASELTIKVHQPSVLADGQTGVTFEATARDRFGLPASDGELRVEVESGTLDYLHRIRAGLFRGRFVPRRSGEAGWVAVSVSAPAVRAVSARVKLLPVSQRWFLVPTVGVLSDLGRMFGPHVGLRAELAVFRRRPLVVIGLEGQVAASVAAFRVNRPEDEAWGTSGGLVFLTRVRAISSGRFGFDLVLDLGVLGVYARYKIRRSDPYVDTVSDAHAAFTVSLGLDAAVLTRNQGEVIFFARVRYLTASYSEGSLSQSGAFLLGIGYRFAL